jgi:hypothetical protein
MQDKILAQRTVFDYAIDLLIDAKLNRWVQYAGVTESSGSFRMAAMLVEK